MTVHLFAPGEHDEFICTHILAGHVANGEIAHVEQEDGSVAVDFPLPTETIEAAILTYDRADYLVSPSTLVVDAARDDAALRLFKAGTITKSEMEAVTGKPYTYGVNLPKPF